MDKRGPAQDNRAVAEREPPSAAILQTRTWLTTPSATALAWAIAIVGAASVIAHGLRGWMPGASLALLYLVGVLVASARLGFWPGIAASLLAFLAYDFFFVEPLHTFSVASAGDVLALLVLLAAGATTGFLTGRLREAADLAESRAQALEHLARFTRELDAAASAAEIELTMLRHLASIDGGGAVLLHAADGTLVPRAAVPDTQHLSAGDLAAAERSHRREVDADAAADGWVGNDYAFRSLGGGHGIVGFRRGPSPSRFAAYDDQIRRSIVRQGRLALEKARLAADAQDARSAAERETLRAALLSSLSHDLRTPLSTILGGITALRELGDAMPASGRIDLLTAVQEEAERLSRYVSNLLHLTRLKSGVELRLEWVDAVDAAHGAVVRARRGHPGRAIELAGPPGPALIRTDAVLLEQAVFNLVDNATRFAPPGSAVQVAVAIDEARLRISVRDEGPGIPAAERARIFEPFFEGKTPDAPSNGLGLAIVRAIATALAGTVAVESPLAGGRGTAFHIHLPMPGAPAR